MALMEHISGTGTIPPRLDNVAEAALGHIQSQVKVLADKVVSYLKSICPIRTGFLRSHACYWGLRVYGLGGFSFAFGWRRRDFYSQKAFYPPYVEFGTGVYGLYGTPIFPRQAARLVWEYEGRYYSAPFIYGQKPRWMLKRALEFGLKEVAKMTAAGFDFGFKTEFYKK